MALFGKKKRKRGDVEEPESGVADERESANDFDDEESPKRHKQSKRRKRRKPRRDSMASILSETVGETAIEEFRSTPALKCERDGMPCYVGLMLRADDVGGISRRSRGDEEKGAMVEAINSGRIHVLITSQMLDDEEIVIVPDVLTLLAMDEYSILVSAPYTIAIVDDDGDVEDTGIDVTYEEVTRLVTDEGGDAEAFLADKGVPWARGGTGIGGGLGLNKAREDMRPVDRPFGYEGDRHTNDDVPPISGSYGQSDPDDTAYAAPIPVQEPASADDDIPFYDGDDDIPLEPVTQDEELPYDVPSYDDDTIDDRATDISDTDMFTGRSVRGTQHATPDTDDDGVIRITGDQVRAVLARKFYSDDLGLEVSSEPFDAYFVEDESFVPFEEDRGDGWMNNYLSQMSKAANSDMRTLRAQNQMILRQRYLTLMDMHCERIVRDLDMDDPSTRYGESREALDARRDVRLSHIADEVDVRSRQLEDDWERRLSEEADAAATAARKAYMDGHERVYERQVMRIEPDLRSEIDEQHADGMRDLRARRRLEAAKRYDLCVTETLAEIADMRLRMIGAEEELRNQWRTDIDKFVEENRRDDIERERVAKAELEERDRVEEVTKEYKAHIDAMRAEFEQDSRRQERRIEAMQRSNADELEKIRNESESRERALQQQVDTLTANNDTLLEQLRGLDEAKSLEWKQRVEASEEQHRREIQRYDEMIDGYRRNERKSSGMTIALIVVMALATLAVGVLIGFAINGASRSSERVVVQQQPMSMNESAMQTDSEAAVATSEAPKASDEASDEASDAGASTKKTKKLELEDATVSSPEVNEFVSEMMLI